MTIQTKWHRDDYDKWYVIRPVENPYKDSVRLLCRLTMKDKGKEAEEFECRSINSIWYDWREAVSLKDIGVSTVFVWELDAAVKDYICGYGSDNYIAEDLKIVCTNETPTEETMARIERIKILAMRDFKRRAVDAVLKAIPYRWFSTRIESVDFWVETGGLVTDCVKYESFSKKEFKKILDEMKREREEISK